MTATDRAVAVFCDFDGTFIEQDVGSSLARRHLAARREALWHRYERGEVDAWEYAVELFSGFDLDESARLAFLEEIAVDPGAESLVALCHARGWRFEVLSDGFDLNISFLRDRFGIDFEFRSNHLEIGTEGWQPSPGGRPRDCDCGTGLCKRQVIEAWRDATPGGLVVHVGNGRVSDLCAALAADHAFAKDTLAPALDALGAAYLSFDTLHDVTAALEGGLAGQGAAATRASLAAGRD